MYRLRIMIPELSRPSQSSELSSRASRLSLISIELVGLSVSLSVPIELHDPWILRAISAGQAARTGGPAALARCVSSPRCRKRDPEGAEEWAWREAHARQAQDEVVLGWRIRRGCRLLRRGRIQRGKTTSGVQKGEQEGAGSHPRKGLWVRGEAAAEKR